MFTIPLTPDNPSLKTKLSVPAHAVLHNKKGEPNAHLLNEYFSINRTLFLNVLDNPLSIVLLVDF